MDPTKIYSTAWRGLGYWLTELQTGWRDYARCQDSCCPGTDLYNYYRGGKDAYKDATTFVREQVLALPYEQQAQPLEDYCAGLCVDPESCSGHYDTKRAEENKNVVYYLSQEIAALRERFGGEE